MNKPVPTRPPVSSHWITLRGVRRDIIRRNREMRQIINTLYFIVGCVIGSLVTLIALVAQIAQIINGR